jgi:anti-sigma B factor antagonist
MLNIQVTESRTLTKTVHLKGRLTSETAGALDEELRRVVDSPAIVVVFDVAGLEYINSAGLQLIFRTRKLMTARGGTALLVNPQATVQKVLEIVGAVDVSTVFASTAELDQYLDTMQRKVAGGEQADES